MSFRLMVMLLFGLILIAFGLLVFQSIFTNKIETTIVSDHPGLEYLSIENPEAWDKLYEDTGLINKDKLYINGEVVNLNNKIEKISIKVTDEAQPFYIFKDQEQKNISSSFVEIDYNTVIIHFYIDEDYIADRNLEYFFHDLIWLIAGANEGERVKDFNMRVQQSRELFGNNDLQLVSSK